MTKATRLLLATVLAVVSVLMFAAPAAARVVIKAKTRQLLDGPYLGKNR